MSKFAWWGPIKLVSNGVDGSGSYWAWWVSYWRGKDGVAYHCRLCDPAERRVLPSAWSISSCVRA